MKKVNLEIIKPWIAKKVTELVGFEDEVVIEYAMGLLEDPHQTVRELSGLLYYFLLTPGLDPRPQENANKSHWVPHLVHPSIHDSTLGSLAGVPG